MRYLLFIILQLIFIGASGQNLQEMPLPELDSTKYDHTIDLKPVIKSNLLLLKFNLEPIKFPVFDFNNIFKTRYQVSNYYSTNNLFLSPGVDYAESFRLTDKITVGSIHFQPGSFNGMPLMVNPLNRNYEVKSMFIDYKVTPKVTISVGTNVIVKKDPFQ